MTLSNKQIALVYVACKELNISEDDRHSIQETVGGSRSLTRMTEAGWMDLVHHFQARGFKNELRLEDSQREARYSKSKLIRKIYAEWHELSGVYYERGKERAALRGFLKKRFGVDHERFLNPERAIKVIEAIKAIKKRKTQGAEGRA